MAEALWRTCTQEEGITRWTGSQSAGRARLVFYNCSCKNRLSSFKNGASSCSCSGPSNSIPPHGAPSPADLTTRASTPDTGHQPSNAWTLGQHLKPHPAHPRVGKTPPQFLKLLREVPRIQMLIEPFSCEWTLWFVSDFPVFTDSAADHAFMNGDTGGNSCSRQTKSSTRSRALFFVLFWYWRFEPRGTLPRSHFPSPFYVLLETGPCSSCPGLH